MNFLLEIGVEELPAFEVEPAARFLARELEKFLKEKEIPFGEIKYFATPRRLTVFIENLAEKEPTKTQLIWGPPKKVAFDSEGKPTKALEGFLRKNQASLEDIEIRQKGKGEYVALLKEVGGKPTAELLKEIVPTLLDKIPFSKKMRWDNSNKLFLRPVRWILALVDDKVLNLSWGSLKADNLTYGHRFINNGGSFRGKPLRVKDSSEYFNLLEEHGVILDHRRRKELIEQALNRYEEEFKVKAALRENLVNENTFLVEYVHPILGSFDEKYLQLPPLVIITVAAHHQRFFCFQKPDGEVINRFLAISNNKPKDDSVVREGYEKVLKARLEDALFFYNEDLKTPLEERVPKLKGILQHPRLGTLYDKTQRLVEISTRLAKDLYPEKVEKAQRAAYLSKADLLTEMVKELDELQGYMGYIYAKAQGEDPEVAKALWEQYQPKGASDQIPQTEVGTILSLADKLHDLVGYFGVGEKPTSTADPYGLRRAALGIIRILDKKRLDLDLQKLLEFTYDQFKELKQDKATTLAQLEEFFKQRLVNYLSEKYHPQVVQAVIKTRKGFDIVSILKTVEELNKLLQTEELKNAREAYRRVKKIIAKVKEQYSVDPTLFLQEEEKKLYQQLVELEKQLENLPIEEQIKALSQFKETIDQFFDNVMVMAKEENIKRNRIALLQRVKKLFERVADLEKLPL